MAKKALLIGHRLTKRGSRRNKPFIFCLWTHCFHIICEGPASRFWQIITKSEMALSFQGCKDKWGCFPPRFLEGNLTSAPHFPQKTPLKYSRASSSRHIFIFIVRDIKRSNYLISELWKHVCYEETSKLSFNWCYFSRRWQGVYLFGTFFPPHKITHSYSWMKMEISFCFILP